MTLLLCDAEHDNMKRYWSTASLLPLRVVRSRFDFQAGCAWQDWRPASTGHFVAIRAADDGYGSPLHPQNSQPPQPPHHTV
eukprot:8473365-Pyramimonas_sp.AAC.1